MNKEDIESIRESIYNDDLLGRLEKLSIFLDNIVNTITEDDVSKEDVGNLLEHIKLQKKIYEDAHVFYESVKEENIEKEEAINKFEELQKAIEEYSVLRGKENK